MNKIGNISSSSYFQSQASDSYVANKAKSNMKLGKIKLGSRREES